MLALLVAVPLAAQQPTPPPAPRDTARAPRDSVRVQVRPAPADSAQNPRPDPGQAIPPRDTSVLADSLNPDSTRPVMPTLGPGMGPRPAGSRWVFDGDAIRWNGAISLGELLARIPGVTVVRAGAYGQPETVSYRGQGAASIELYRDGFQLDPLGEDSVGFDTGRFDIGMYRRIEVEVLPTVLRVHLLTDTQVALRPRTEASFATGDASTNSYRVRYLNRWRSGAGLALNASYLGTAGPLTSQAKSNQLTLWGKATWMPSDRSGVELQGGTYTFDAEGIAPAGGGVTIPARKVHRTDVALRAFAATRSDGMGLRLDALLGSSVYRDTARAVNPREAQALVSLGWAAPRLSAETWGRVRDGRAPFEAGVRAAWSPLRALALSGYGRRRTVSGANHGATEAYGAAEFRPLPWVAFRGDARWRRLQDSMFAASDTVETVLDWSAGAGMRTGPLTLDVALTRRGDFSAPAFGTFAAQVPRQYTPGTTAPEITWRFQPRSWISLSGWFRHPDSDSIPWDPPTHSVTRLTFRSQFLPQFRRGAFDVEAQFEVEGWGDGVMGRDSTGAPLKLSGHTVANFFIQFRLVGALIYWTMRNSQYERYQMLPGFFAPRAYQRFGIRWEFTN